MYVEYYIEVSNRGFQSNGYLINKISDVFLKINLFIRHFLLFCIVRFYNLKIEHLYDLYPKPKASIKTTQHTCCMHIIVHRNMQPYQQISHVLEQIYNYLKTYKSFFLPFHIFLF